MAITITSGAQSITVREILGYASSRTSSNIVHRIIGRNDPDVTLGTLGLRTGTLELLTDTLAEAFQKEAHLALSGVQQLADTEVPQVNMRFVVVGDVSVTLDDTTRTAAVVGFNYQEVL